MKAKRLAGIMSFFSSPKTIVRSTQQTALSQHDTRSPGVSECLNDNLGKCRMDSGDGHSFTKRCWLGGWGGEGRKVKGMEQDFCEGWTKSSRVFSTGFSKIQAKCTVDSLSTVVTTKAAGEWKRRTGKNI